MSLFGLCPILVFQKRILKLEKRNKEISKNNYYDSEGNIEKTTKRIAIDEVYNVKTEGVWSGWGKWFDVDFKSLKFLEQGAPIPIPLMEETGLVLFKERSSFSNNISHDGDFITQAANTDSITLELRARNNSFLVSSLIGLLEYTLSYPGMYALSVSYFNDIIFCKECYVGSFNIENSNSGMYNISLTIDKGKSFLDRRVDYNTITDKKNGKGDPLDDNQTQALKHTYSGKQCSYIQTSKGNIVPIDLIPGVGGGI
jgi:hypothetical protein